MILSLFFSSYINIHKIEINEPNIPYLVTKSYLGLSMSIWNKHFWHSNDGHFGFGNKSLTNVAEMYFIGFVDRKNISFGTKCIFLAGL